jgi:hypothetical protein
MNEAAKYKALFDDFCKSGDSLQIYNDGSLIYSSSEKMLLPLMEYIETKSYQYHKVVVFDKIAGNAAALLLVTAGCSEVFSPLGSKPAVETLKKHGIKHHIRNIVPFITRPGTETMCPMEKLSLGKTPESFYAELKQVSQREK